MAAELSMRTLARAVGLIVLSGGLGVVVGLLGRWYARELVSEGLAVLVGLGGVALYLNTAGALGSVIGGETGILSPVVALSNVATFLVAGVVAAAGARTGDRFGAALFAFTGTTDVEADVSRLVRSMGRVVTVDLPEEVEDVPGYDPVDAERKSQLAGRTLVFPGRLTVEELRSRLVDRLERDFGVGHVDVDVTVDGEVTYLAVGSRVSGLGPTLPPGSAAVAVRADPAFAASAGDVVQLWRTDDDPERVTSGEVRGTAGDVVTVAVDAADAEALSPEGSYRLVTLPVEPRADREFAGLLRSVEETMDAVEVTEGSPLVGIPVGAIDVAIVAVRTTEDDVEPLPSRSRTLAAGESVYAIARPDDLRRLERAARTPDVQASTVATPSPGTDND